MYLKLFPVYQIGSFGMIIIADTTVLLLVWKLNWKLLYSIKLDILIVLYKLKFSYVPCWLIGNNKPIEIGKHRKLSANKGNYCIISI